MRMLVWRYYRGWSRSQTALARPLMPLPLVGVALAGTAVLAVALTVALALFALVVGTTIAAAVIGALAVGGWQIARLVAPGLGQRPAVERIGVGGRGYRPDKVLASPVEALRHRYAAGEIGQTEFKQRLVDLLKERYVRGDLTLGEYESRVRHVLSDPALQSPA
jgi:hypothetical protein